MGFRIITTSNFKKEVRKLPINIQELVKIRGRIFYQNPFDQSLGTHKLSGKLKDHWAFSINYHYRIMFIIEGEKIYLEAIGKHSIYDRFR